jgi:hypothetical protein
MPVRWWTDYAERLIPQAATTDSLGLVSAVLTPSAVGRLRVYVTGIGRGAEFSVTSTPTLPYVLAGTVAYAPCCTLDAKPGQQFEVWARAADSRGYPVALPLEVRWTVLGGGGRLAWTATTLQSSVALNYWVVGPSIGTQEIEATMDGVAVRFTARVTP